MKKDIKFAGHNLKTLSGTVDDVRADGTTKTRNVWENHGLFGSRQQAADFARKNRSGRKYHVSGVRVDVTAIEPPRRETK